MDILFDWETEGDRFSFEDSDRFEEDSLCSWISEPESLCNNWRGWKRQNGGQPVQVYRTQDGEVKPLVELTAQAVACHIPFEVVEHFPQPIPEQLQLRIAFWSFPENEEDIRLYSCLANGSAEEFQKGEHLYKAKAVKETLQIGFHLSATVIPPQPTAQAKGTFSVAVVFDRRRISSCTCTCNSNPSWCAHVVALCLYRIHQASSVCLRAPVSESLSRLHREQLQKFAQYLISELPQQILPTAQRLLDELLSSQQTAINTVCGAPDPTAGPSANEQTSWCLDENTLHDNVKKTLIKFCVPAPVVFSDVNYLTSTAPPAAAEWQSLLRPLRGREPEGMWNLLSIVREMFRRSDSNAVPLLEIITDETLQCEQILIWWFSSKITVSHCSGHGRNNNNGSSSATQNAAASLCDEIVTLWRFAALNPKISTIQRDDLCAKFKDWHMGIIDKVRKARGPNVNGPGTIKKVDIEGFVGFKPAVEACQMDWTEYKIPGVTFPEHSNWHYTFTRVNENEGKKPSRVQPMSICSEDIISTDGSTTIVQASSMYEEMGLSAQDKCHVYNTRREMNRVKRAISDGACSSGSEGFCDADRDPMLRDSDSSCEKDMNSRSNSIEEPDMVNPTPNMIPATQNVALENGAACGSINSNVLSTSDVEVNSQLYITIENKDVASDQKERVSCENPLLEPLSESQQSSDEYQVYLFDPKVKPINLADKKKKDKYEEPDYFAGIKCMESQQEVLFAQAEALYAHGLTMEACILARQLAEELLANPPDLLVDSSSTQTPKGKKKKATHNISILVSSLVSRSAFLCSVLSEEVDCHHLAFKVGMYGLEMPRPPASTKALEVKIAYQETELVTLLKKIPLGPLELGILRERAEQLRDGTLRSRGEALLPLMLASFTFDSLCLPVCPVSGCNSRPPSRSLQTSVRLPSDETLGFDAAVAALGLKAKVSEADHPLLCECSRRQRGDLAIAMLFHYKDDQVKLSKIMDKLLDKEVHQLYKAPSLATYLSSKPTSHHPVVTTTCQGQSTVFCQANASRQEAPSQQSIPKVPVTPLERSPAPSDDASTLECSQESSDWPDQSPQRLDYLNLEHTGPGTQLNATSTSSPPRPKLNYRHSSGKDTDSSALEDDGDDLKALEAKIRCMSIKKKPSQGMASIDSSAPETTSSDNSPTLIRRNWGKPQGPGSDSGSSGKSSASLGSNSSSHKTGRVKLRENESPPSPYVFRMSASQLIVDSRSSTPNIKGISFSRHKGKTRIMPTVPNQPSEASAHFMCELAKIVLTKAGGNSSTSLFNPQPSTNNSHTGPHRALHLCAFQIGLYALGLHNCVSPNWLSRTYSSHVSWISGQAMEIGSASINILIDTWEGHLTPQEVITLADRASRGRDPNMQRAAAELALSCLPHAQALNPAEVHRALFQCKEISIEMLQKACMAVENAAKSGGVFPEVLFDVARRWYELAEEAASLSQSNNSGNLPNQGAAAPPPVAVSLACVERSSPTNHHAIAFNPNPAPTQAQNTLPLQLLPHPPGHVTPQAVIIPYTIASTNHHHPRMPPHSTYVAPYSYVQQLQPFPHFQPVQIPHHIQHTYVATYPYQNQPQFSANTPPIYATNPAQLRPLQLYATNPACTASPIQNLPGQVAPLLVDQQNFPPAPTSQQGAAAPVQVQHIAHNSAQMTYLLACYRVGMLAMETLARRLHETKFTRNPPNGEDIKWLLGISLKLGTSYIQQFCASAVNAVLSPFVLYDITLEIAHSMSRNNPAQIHNHLRSNLVSPLVQKCMQMFVQCAHQRMHHISQADYDEFVGIICSARNAFCIAPGGMVQFNDLLQSLRRSKSCRKDLWQRIVSGLSTGNA